MTSDNSLLKKVVNVILVTFLMSLMTASRWSVLMPLPPLPQHTPTPLRQCHKTDIAASVEVVTHVLCHSVRVQDRLDHADLGHFLKPLRNSCRSLLSIHRARDHAAVLASAITSVT